MIIDGLCVVFLLVLTFAAVPLASSEFKFVVYG